MPYASGSAGFAKPLVKPRASDAKLGLEYTSPMIMQSTRRNPRGVESTNVNLVGSAGGAFDTAFKRQVNEEMEEMRNKMAKQHSNFYEMQRNFAAQIQ
jgi:hypothetical protein